MRITRVTGATLELGCCNGHCATANSGRSTRNRDPALYATDEPLFNNGSSQIREIVEVPSGLVADLPQSDICELRDRQRRGNGEPLP